MTLKRGRMHFLHCGCTSRQEYLTKREVQQIELLRKEIADEEAYFHGMKVTKQEQEDLERKKEILRLVEERLKITTSGMVTCYLKTTLRSRAKSTRRKSRMHFTSDTKRPNPRMTSLSQMSTSGRLVKRCTAHFGRALWTKGRSPTITSTYLMKARPLSSSWTRRSRGRE
ncbi:hypothetical protein EV424DRAFT_325527 [Suillus variegatus]|nr:hypothetical protein EV424DRAFT_325527 [Suillus variegatus]